MALGAGAAFSGCGVLVGAGDRSSTTPTRPSKVTLCLVVPAGVGIGPGSGAGSGAGVGVVVGREDDEAVDGVGLAVSRG